MVHADLHTHTTNSDGTLTLDEVPAAAREAGVAVVAVTDHDRPHPGFDATVVERDGVTLVHGIELRVTSPAGRVDLLGYGLDPTDELLSLTEGIQRNRRERGRAIVECVEDRLGVDLDVEIRAGLGRPHVARAIADHPDSGYDYEGAFDHLIGDDGPCFVAREIPSFDEGRRVLGDACRVVGLAHPFRYDDPAAALDLATELDAVERYYPYGRDVDPAPVERVAVAHDLLLTGGSDAHERTLGVAGLDRAAFEPVAGALGLA